MNVEIKDAPLGSLIEFDGPGPCTSLGRIAYRLYHPEDRERCIAVVVKIIDSTYYGRGADLDLGYGTRVALVDPETLLSVTEAAACLSVTRRRVLALIEEKRLPAQPVGNQYVIRAEDVLNYRPLSTGRPRKTAASHP